ncbi:MAG: hypothetical protein EOO36_19945, partial [Cytophagaceae bacterium]
MKKLLRRLRNAASLVLAVAGATHAQQALDLGRPTYYPRVIRLGQGAGAGRLLASFDAGRAGAIYESPDNGKTWQHLTDVADPNLSPDGAWVAYTVARVDTATDKRDADV